MGKFKRRKFIRAYRKEQLRVLPSSKKEGGRTTISIMHGGKQIWEGDKKDLLPTLFGMFIDQINYWSEDAVKNLISEVISMITETLPDRGLLLHRKLEHGERMSNAEYVDALYYIWNTFLASEGLGLLPGFGMAICEKTEEGKRRMLRRLFVNPETTSIYQEM